VEEKALAEVFAFAATASTILVVCSMRALGFAYIFPLFSWTRIAGPVRLVFALGVSLPLAAPQFAQSAMIDALTPLAIGALIVKELLLGMVTGLFLAIPFWGAQAAGDIIDLFRGASAADLADPVNASQASILGTINIQLALGLFVTAGGFTAALGALYQTFALWPVFGAVPLASGASLSALMGIVDALLWIGLVLAAPLLIAMLLADLMLVFVTRSSRNFQVYHLSITFKNLVMIALAPVYATFFSSYVGSDWSQASIVFERFMGLR